MRRLARSGNRAAAAGGGAAVLAVWLCLAACVHTEPVAERPPAAPSHPATAPAAVVPTPPPSPPPVAAPDFQQIAEETLRIRLMTGVSQLTLSSGGVLEVQGAALHQQWNPGAYVLRLASPSPAPRRFHLFVKTFVPRQFPEAQGYADAWRQQGFPAQVFALGKRFRADDGALLDNRLQYVSLTSFPTKSQADAEKARLQKLGQWSWIEEEVVAPGAGQVVVSGGGGYPTPILFHSHGPITVTPLGAKAVICTGAIELQVGPDGRLAVFEIAPLEEYLAGVLPAEMPASWPAEALKAQAMAARSEVLANLGVKHKLEGFDYCAGEHCRAYNGFSWRRPASDAAAASTAGLVLTDGARVIPTVFSSNCGGWTESNENVWAAPPDPFLRGVGDFAPGANPAPRGPVTFGLGQWLTRGPAAFCSGDTANYRWVRRYTAAELTSLVNKAHPVGTVREIRLGERGVSGRLKSVDIIGLKGASTVRKELPIRQAFGGLPSAAFILDVERSSKGPTAFVFKGAGRGHGVGLCQHGAQGMAVRGWRCTDILTHYFSGTRTVRLE